MAEWIPNEEEMREIAMRERRRYVWGFIVIIAVSIIVASIPH